MSFHSKHECFARARSTAKEGKERNRRLDGKPNSTGSCAPGLQESWAALIGWAQFAKILRFLVAFQKNVNDI